MPFDLTNGSAKHCCPAAHDSTSHVPTAVVIFVASAIAVAFEVEVHVAKEPPIHAVSPTDKSSCE